jgi:hypothetical protein
MTIDWILGAAIGGWMSLTLGTKSPDEAQRASQEKPSQARLRHIGRLIPGDSLPIYSPLSHASFGWSWISSFSMCE